MATISAGVGLISGLPIDDLVNSLISIQRQPIVLLQGRLGTLVGRRTALMQISAQLLSIQNVASRMSAADSFRRTQAASSDDSVMLASAASGSALGQFTFTVRNLASSHQVISAGFATRDATLVGAGDLTIEAADAILNRATPLSTLNGGTGVQAGRIRITDRAGASAEVELRTASTIDDVVNAINLQADADVTARVEGDHLVLEDQTGLTTGALSVSEVGGGHTAADLGLLVSEIGGVLTGGDLVTLAADTRLDDLNDGNGVRVLKSQRDLRISLADGTALDYDLSGRLSIEDRDNGDGTFTDLSTSLSLLNRGAGVPAGTIRVTNHAGAQAEIDLSSAETLRDVTTAEEWAALDLTVSVSGSRLMITDNSTGEGTLLIEDVDGTTAEALGIAGSSRDDTLTGEDIFFVETLGDVIRVIHAHADNSDGAGGSKLTASFSTEGAALTLTDHTTGSEAFAVEAANGSDAAYDLGIAGRASGNTIESRRLLSGLNTVLLRSLNGGGGVSQQLTLGTPLSALHRGAGIPLGQIRITQRDGTEVDVDLAGTNTLGDIKTAIEAASGELNVTLSGAHLLITDQSVGEGETPVSDLIVEDLAGGAAAGALGITGSTSEDTLTGQDLYTAIGDIQLTDRSGVTTTVDLSQAESLADVIAAINAAPTAIIASVSSSGLGIELVDTSGGSGSLMVEDVAGSTTAVDLNIAFNGNEDHVASGNLQRQYVSAANRLETFRSGSGVPIGSFRITNSQGLSRVVDLTQGNESTLQDVIDEINSRGLDVVARINDTGDGLFLEDLAGGSGRLTVAEEGGATARALGVLGQAAEGETTLDGSFESRIAVAGGDTLEDVVAKLRDSDAPVNATIINDGTGVRPYRLNLTSTVSGALGRLAIDVGTTGLSFETLMEARDATVLFGDENADAPLVLTSSTNTLSDAIPGVRLDLVGTSNEPVTINLTQDVDAIVADLSGFVVALNAAIDKIDELTRYDAETETRGVLTGDSTARRVRQRLIDMAIGTIEGFPSSMNHLREVGIKLESGSSFQFDEDVFREALENNPEGVVELFTHEETDADGAAVITGFGGLIQDEIERLIEGETGLIPIQEQALRASEELLNERIGQLEVLLDRRRQRLLAEFYAMETALARLQSQQSALSGLTTLNVGTQAGLFGT